MGSLRDKHPGRQSPTARLKFLFVHAHFDDYEFTAAGTFARCRRAFGRAFTSRVVICTDGAAGHHRMTRRETAKRRLAEQKASARLGRYDFKLLKLPGGEVPREGCLQPDSSLLAALWFAIRDFEPDYVFCPPLPVDPLVGVHVDHCVVAEAVRRVAYLINVPHAFTPEFPAEERRSRPCKIPIILNTSDSYMAGVKGWDLAVDIGETFQEVALLSWQHQSQIREWLPWVGRHDMTPPASLSQWEKDLRVRFLTRQRRWGIRRQSPVEVFTVTGWGEKPSIAGLRRDFPGLQTGAALVRLRRRLRAL